MRGIRGGVLCRARLFSRQEAGAVGDDLSARFRALARSRFARERASRGGLEGEDDAGDDREGRGTKGLGCTYIGGHVRAEADSHFGGGESESSPRECVCTCRGGKGMGGLGTGELGVARGRRDGVNAQFVFRSGGKTRSLHRIARRTRRNSSSSPMFVSSLDSSR